MSDAKIRENLRNIILKNIKTWAEEEYGTVLQVKGNKLAIACLDEEQNDRWCELTIAIPTGARDDTEGYDAEGMAEEYRIIQAEKEEKAKQRKAEADKKIKEREEKKKIKAEKKKGAGE